MPASRSRRPAEGGQILVVFAMSMLVIIGVVGLAVDGGSTFAQRRDQQTAADLSALAGANDYLVNNQSATAITRAREIAASNNFTNGASSTVDVTINTSNGVAVTVQIGHGHRNSFLGALGMANWQVTTSATALAGFPDSATGAGPFIFSISAFENDGTPKYQSSTDFGETNGDVPTSGLDLAWTNYGTGNVNTSEVDDIIRSGLDISRTMGYGEYIGQHNNGNHTSLFQDVDTYLSGLDLPVAVVDSNGNFMGWATFHVNSASAGSSKHINGYFMSSFTSERLTVGSCASNACPRYLGSYVLKLTN
jgi:Flp pilus assembly protein TadG